MFNLLTLVNFVFSIILLQFCVERFHSLPELQKNIFTRLLL